MEIKEGQIIIENFYGGREMYIERIRKAKLIEVNSPMVLDCFNMNSGGTFVFSIDLILDGLKNGRYTINSKTKRKKK